MSTSLLTRDVLTGNQDVLPESQDECGLSNPLR